MRLKCFLSKSRVLGFTLFVMFCCATYEISRLHWFEKYMPDNGHEVARRNKYTSEVQKRLHQKEIFCRERNVGCFQAQSNLNEELVIVVTFNLMTINWCTSFCASHRQSYAGLRNSSTCVCAKDAPQDFVILQKPEVMCNIPCPGNSDEACGGENSFSVHRIVLSCVKAPFSDDFIQSRELGCFWHPAPEASFHRYNATSSKDCLLICEIVRRPVAAYSTENGCQCGQMTERFNLIHKTADCKAAKSVRAFRTTATDERCEAIQLLPSRASQRTLLTSFPGSGNTWTRYMLEAATGYYTGSVYSDKLLIKTGFIGEALKPEDNRTDIIKDHLFGKKLPSLDQTILVIRNPYYAMKAEFNRQKSHTHHGKATAQQFKMGFEGYCNKAMHSWKNNIIKVLESKRPFRVFYFEDMIANPIETTREMVEFLANPALHPSNLVDRLACLSQQVSGENKRKPILANFDPYTARMKNTMNKIIKEVRQALRKAGIKSSLPKYEVTL